jgi:hypothetical protein
MRPRRVSGPGASRRAPRPRPAAGRPTGRRGTPPAARSARRRGRRTRRRSRAARRGRAAGRRRSAPPARRGRRCRGGPAARARRASAGAAAGRARPGRGATDQLGHTDRWLGSGTSYRRRAVRRSLAQQQVGVAHPLAHLRGRRRRGRRAASSGVRAAPGHQLGGGGECTAARAARAGRPASRPPATPASAGLVAPSSGRSAHATDRLRHRRSTARARTVSSSNPTGRSAHGPRATSCPSTAAGAWRG